MAKFYVGRGRGPRGFDEYIVPIKWLRRFAHKGRMRAATEEEVQRYALAETFRPVRLLDLPEIPPPLQPKGDFIELPQVGEEPPPLAVEEPPVRPSRKQRSP